MTERTLRIILGVLILAALYLDINSLMYFVIGLLFFQGITNWRVAVVTSRLRYGPAIPLNRIFCTHPDARKNTSLMFEAERALCLVLACVLTVSEMIYPTHFWFISWITGFGLLGAGLSGICPATLALRGMGFQ
jgi:hypothetical protein